MIDVSKLVELQAVKTGSAGHYSIVPRQAGLIQEWIGTRGTSVIHRFTRELMNARTGEVIRQK